MLKLGAFTDEIGQDLKRVCKVLNEFGATGAEIRGVWDTPSQELTDAQVRDIKTIVADHGITVCSLASPFGKCSLDSAEQVAQHMDFLRRCSDIARELDCRVVRGFAFWDRDQVDEKPWDAMIAAYEPVPGILEEKGVYLGLENEASCYVGTAGHTRTFLDKLGCDRVKVCWDPANHLQDPQSTGVPTFPDGYVLVKDDLIHVHVKDAALNPDGSRPNVFMGMGEGRWPEQLQALKDDGYEGYLSLETHVNPDKFPPEMQDKYGQYLTGEGREPASKVCLAWIRDAMAALT